MAGGPQPPVNPFGGDPLSEYLIHDQADLDALFQSILRDFNGIAWLPYLEGELRGLEKLHDVRFKTKGSRFFTAAGGWAPNAPSTVRAKGHARVLFGKPSQGFRLSRSLTQEDAGEFGVRETIDEWPRLAEAIFGTTAPYSIYNQYGTSRIPARPHVGMTEEFFNAAAERAVDHAFRAIQES